MSDTGARVVAAALALKPLGLHLFVSPSGDTSFVVAADPDHPEAGISYETIGQVEAFIADRERAAHPLVPSAPRVGDLVHYVSYGAPGGEECRAAIVTELTEVEVNEQNPAGDGVFRQAVSLCVLNPTGQSFERGVLFDAGAGAPGDPECLSRVNHGNPFRYCECGWIEPHLAGATWHFAEH